MKLSSFFKYTTILNPRSLAGTGFLSVLLSIIVLSGTVGSLWIFEKIKQKEATLASIRQNYTDANRVMLRKDVQQVIDYIHYKRDTTESRMRISLREHVLTAYTLASHIYSMNRGTKSVEDIGKQIRETLRPIRWDNSLGYYFIISENCTLLLNALNPELENLTIQDVLGSEFRYTVKEMQQLVKTTDSGFYRYAWSKPGQEGTRHTKLAYLKRFQPLEWVIGGGAYLEDMEATIQDEILTRISQMKFPNNQYIFVIRYDGLILSHPMPQYHKKFLFDNEHHREYKEIRELINVSKQENGGFVTYEWEKPGTGVLTPKMTYGASIHDWEWVIGTGVYLDDLQNVIDTESRLFNDQLKNEIFLLILSLLACLACSVIAGFFMTRRLQSGLSAFTDFLQKAADKDIKIDRSRLAFYEFEVLGDLTNQMVEDRIQKEQALTKSITETRQLQRLLQNITDSMPSALITVDREMKVLQWNTEAERITGISSASAKDRLLNDIYPLTPREHELILQTLTTSLPCFETRLQKKQETGVSYEDITIYPLVFDTLEGAVIRIDSTTDKVRLEEMMIQSEKMLSVGGLAAGMAHEINNPLAGIMGNLHVLENRLMKDLPANRKAAEESNVSLKDFQDYLKRRNVQTTIDSIRKAGIRAATIVSDMLSFSRQSNSAFSRCSVPELLDKTVELASTDYDLKNRFDFRNIRIIRQYDADLPPVMCESSKLQQVFLNILTNGAQAMATMGQGHAPIFHLRIRNQSPDCIIEIEDNGPGMEKEVAKRIFEPFFTTKEVGLGTGLGLSVSYFIVVDHHKGSLSVSSTPGKGTCFLIRLPIVQPDHPGILAAGTGTPQAPPSGRPDLRPDETEAVS